MTSNELRAEFLKFFENKGHTVISSSSLIPKDDPTLLLTTAGMVQIKPYFTGEAVPPNKRLASCQKCFRTTDIESVGDKSHNTFFEMLGNFSVGDYFKKEAINWAWEFVTVNMKLLPERLWITIYKDDDEAFDLWREIGIPESKIVKFDEKDNFWGPAGETGPCGPCSEIHYDFGEKYGCRKPTCGPNCDCGRFIEFWNLVFTQFDQDKAGNRRPLPKPNIDTGMGLERLSTIIQKKTSIYETDLFTPLIDYVSELSGIKYGTDEDSDNAIRVVAEHGRSMAFLVGDGVMPGNEGRGYVLRRLFRRAALFGRRIGLEGKFLTETAKVTIKQMGHIYPELVQRQDFILKTIEQEQTGFNATLNIGLELLDGIMEKVAGKKEKAIPGKEAFKLYDTYGFPVELTKEIAESRGFSVDMEGYQKEMEKQRQRAKAAQKFDLAERNVISAVLDIKETVFTGYHNYKQKTNVIALLAGNDSVSSVNKRQVAGIILKDTPFYGEMGGQVGDTGVISGEKGNFLVTDTVRIPPDIIVHRGEVESGVLAVGDNVEVEVDIERRLDIARNHTATHLLQAALREVLGGHIQQRGSLVAPDRFRFDFSHLTAMTSEETGKVQRVVNNHIRKNFEVYDEGMSYKKAISEGVTALFDEKYGDVVRVLRIGKPPISAELCGGTHVSTTGEIGLFHIISESSIGSGLRRIEAVTGRGAERYIDQKLADLQKIAGFLEIEPDYIVTKTHDLLNEVKNERRQRQALEMKLAKKDTESIEDKAREIGGVKVLSERVPPAGMENLRSMVDDLLDRLGSGVIVLGTVWEDKPAFVVSVTQDLVGKGLKAGEIIKRVAEVTGGSGGGRANIAQGGGKNLDKLDDALEEAFRYVEEKLSK